MVRHQSAAAAIFRVVVSEYYLRFSLCSARECSCEQRLVADGPFRVFGGAAECRRSCVFYHGRPGKGVVRESGAARECVTVEPSGE